MQAKKRSLQRNAAKQKAVRTGINWWKWLFLILVGLLLGTGIWFTKTALMPVKINSTPPNDHDIQRPGIYRQSHQK